MRSFPRLYPFCLLLPIIAVAPSSARAQEQAKAEGSHAAASLTSAILQPNQPKALTGKERLGEKWTDEQRTNNCKVPVDKRGPKPRPATCAHVPTG
jgi:hypothetical protein